jgi:dTDP-4-amino-4,6-dideoxygalactose transaminase
MHLSPPDVGQTEISAVVAALESGWVAPAGPEISLFETEIAASADRPHAVALSSGTAALHLGLRALGVRAGDEVVVPTLTFGATAFAVKYLGAEPLFVDCEPDAWSLDAQLLRGLFEERGAEGRLPAAVVGVDLFGRTCDYDALEQVCAEYGVPLVLDSAEALGGAFGSTPAGSRGRFAIFSFNGNKIITTSGGGALVTDDAEMASRVRKWASQSREPLPWYEHEEIGFNYRMSNVLAALGRAQLARLPEIIQRRRHIRDRYSGALQDVPGVTVMGDPLWGRSNAWLTTVTFDNDHYPAAAERVRKALDAEDIEARPIWKPMHRQPVFAHAHAVLSGVADRAFRDGLCLPSGTGMSDADIDRVLSVVVDELT